MIKITIQTSNEQNEWKTDIQSDGIQHNNTEGL